MTLPGKLLRVAWLSIVLGIVMQLLVVLGGASRANLVRDTLSKVSWSMLVCFGVALGASVAAKRPQMMGLAGLLAAPTAFVVARTVHKAFSFAAGRAGSEPMTVILLVAVVKAAEYATFGLLTGWLGEQKIERALPYAVTGAGIGLFFGSLIAAATTTAVGAKVLPAAINEILFPIGCALVLFASRLLTYTAPRT